MGALTQLYAGTMPEGANLGGQVRRAVQCAFAPDPCRMAYTCTHTPVPDSVGEDRQGEERDGRPGNRAQAVGMARERGEGYLIRAMAPFAAASLWILALRIDTNHGACQLGSSPCKNSKHARADAIPAFDDGPFVCLHADRVRTGECICRTAQTIVADGAAFVHNRTVYRASTTFSIQSKAFRHLDSVIRAANAAITLIALNRWLPYASIRNEGCP